MTLIVTGMVQAGSKGFDMAKLTPRRVVRVFRTEKECSRRETFHRKVLYPSCSRFYPRLSLVKCQGRMEVHPSGNHSRLRMRNEGP